MGIWGWALFAAAAELAALIVIASFLKGAYQGRPNEEDEDTGHFV